MYRIKAKQCWSLTRRSKFYVQCKYKYLPFWITITSSFDSIEQAQQHIDLKLKVYK